MSSIDALSGNNPYLSQISSLITQDNTQSAQQSQQSNFQKAMQPVADLLGMSSDELSTAMQSGTTLASLASQKGISEQTLESTIAQGLKANAPADAPAGVDFSKMATDIANGVKPGGGHHHHGGGLGRLNSDGQNQSQSSNLLSDLSNDTGIDPQSLLQQLSDILGNSGSSSTSTSGDDSSSTSSSSDTTTTATASDDSENTLKAALQNILNQYGSKGLSYDTEL